MGAVLVELVKTGFSCLRPLRLNVAFVLRVAREQYSLAVRMTDRLITGLLTSAAASSTRWLFEVMGRPGSAPCGSSDIA